MKRFVVTIFTLFLISGNLALCDSKSNVGRLPDGRAYRTDAEGNQLVDYLAELELSVENLNRQVRGLEDEVKTKQATIERLEQAKPVPATVSERDLIGKESSGKRDTRAGAATAIAGSPTSVTCPVCQPPTELCGAQNRIISQLNATLEETKTDLQVEKQLNEKRTAALQHQLASLQSDLEISRGETQSLRASLSQNSEQMNAAQEALNDSREAAEQARAELARVERERAQAAAQTRASLSLSEAPASLSASRMRAVEIIRGKLQTQFNQVRGLLGTRDELYKRYSKQKHVVAFKPARASSSRGMALADVTKALRQAGSVSELSLLSHDLSEIEGKLQEDIGLMKRMDRVR